MHTYRHWSKNTQIIKLIDDVVSEGYITFTDCRDCDKDTIVAAIMLFMGKDAYEAVVESRDFDMVVHHLKMYLETGDKDYAHDLAETMRKNAISYFTDQLEKLFQERHSYWYQDRMAEAGCKPVRCQQTGQLEYR